MREREREREREKRERRERERGKEGLSSLGSGMLCGFFLWPVDTIFKGRKVAKGRTQQD